jgi:hypothetical protein
MNNEEKLEKLETLVRHIKAVQENCERLGRRLIHEGKFELGKRLIANSMSHDNSKFGSLEWDHLTRGDEDDEMLDVVIAVHNSSNLHHPEYWDGIKNMPAVHVAEMVCDWKTRSSELGTDLKEWIDRKATKRWKFSQRDAIYKQIMMYVDMLIEPGL